MRPIQILRRLARCVAAGAGALGCLAAHADIIGVSGGTTSGSSSFSLFAEEGYINAADGMQIYTWGYGAAQAVGGTGRMQYVGPTLLVRQGDAVTVTFENRLPTPTSLLFPGQSGVTATCGAGGGCVPGVLATEVGPGKSVTYNFTAAQPGTYLYQSGSQPGLQVEMGLVGAIVVYPTGADLPAAGATKWAYHDAKTAYERETLAVVTEMDSDIHAAIDEQVKGARNAPTPPACLTTTGCVFTADMTRRFPKYWFLNGRTSPDVFSKNFVGELPHQPYNTLPRLHPGERMLLRMVGGGTDLHPMHHHGNNSWEIARDGRLLSSDAATKGANLAVSDYTIKVVPGQTTDAIWTWTGAGLGWDVYGRQCGGTGQPTCDAVYTDARQLHQLPSDRGKPIPAKIPSELELAYGEFYSGSPYLGDFGVRPVGAGVANTTGAFFHMFHSHAEREVVNGGIFPGGMMTMMVIEPFTVSIRADQP